MRNLARLTYAALLCLSQLANAVPKDSIQFDHKDWELACDNTRTCRAAGYSDDDAGDNHLSVLLTRRAGPGQAVKAQLQLGHYESDDIPHTLQMRIAGRTLGTVKLDAKTLIGDLSPVQTTALLEAIVKDQAPVWAVGAEEWVLSTKGANAVLLKMDEFQGRLDTASALLRKGSKPESQVLPALPAPVIVAAAVPAGTLKRAPLTPQQERSLLAELRRSVKADDCERLADADVKLEYAPLSGSQLLVSTLCWRAAYNEGAGYWIVNASAPFAPRLVTNTGTDYDRGEIHAVQKGRGIADCLSTDTWTWDGKAFVHTASGTTGMCREIAAGGAWDLPTVVTQVQRSK